MDDRTASSLLGWTESTAVTVVGEENLAAAECGVALLLSRDD